MNEPRIYLTGFMGSGKSTIGAKLAQTLGYTFIDLDREIETVTGMSIPTIFARLGEVGFREIERHALDSTIGRSRVVIALGGGAIVSENALNVVLTNGLVIYLRVSLDDLVRRLSKSTRRPLLSGREDLHDYVSQTLEQRTPFYESAHITLDCSGKKIRQIVTSAADAVSFRAIKPL